MRNRGIRENTLHVGFPQRKQVSHEHRQPGDDGEHPREGGGDHPVCRGQPAEPACPYEGGGEDARKGDHHGALGDRRDVACHRGGGAVVDVRGPEVERDHRELEPDAYQHHAQAHGRKDALRLEGPGERGERHRAGERVDECHAEEEKRR